MKSSMTQEEFGEYFRAENTRIINEVKSILPAKTLEDVIKITKLTEELQLLTDEYKIIFGVAFHDNK